MSFDQTQEFKQHSGRRRHLELPSPRFLEVVEALRKEHPHLHPHFLSLWPDSYCRKALQCVVDDLQGVPEDMRIHESTFHLATHLRPLLKRGLQRFRHENLTVSVLCGVEAPGVDKSKIPTEPEDESPGARHPGASEEEEFSVRDLYSSPTKPARGANRGAMEGRDDETLASWVRNIDSLARISMLPWYSAFVVQGCFLALQHEMDRIGATSVETIFEMAQDEGDKGWPQALCVMALLVP